MVLTKLEIKNNRWLCEAMISSEIDNPKMLGKIYFDGGNIEKFPNEPDLTTFGFINYPGTDEKEKDFNKFTMLQEAYHFFDGRILKNNKNE